LPRDGACSSSPGRRSRREPAPRIAQPGGRSTHAACAATGQKNKFALPPRWPLKRQRSPGGICVNFLICRSGCVAE
jgi:hypothetical protein